MQPRRDDSERENPGGCQVRRARVDAPVTWTLAGIGWALTGVAQVGPGIGRLARVDCLAGIGAEHASICRWFERARRASTTAPELAAVGGTAKLALRST